MKVLYDSQAFDMQTHGGVSRCFAELYSHLPQDIEASLSVMESANVYLKTLGINQMENYIITSSGRKILQ